MKLLRHLFAFYINSSIHVALAVVALTFITVLEYGITISTQLLMFIFFGAITGYNFVKYAKIAGLHHRHLAHSLKAIQIFSAICFLILLFAAFHLPLKLLLIAGCFGVPTFFYAVPLIRHKNLRSLTGIKIFIVAFVWGGITVIVPITAAGADISGDVLLTFFQRMTIVVALMIPFEIRDVPYDALNLKTLPQQIGVWGTKMLGEGILLICLVFEFLKENTDLAYLSSLFVFSVILGGLLIISKPYQSRYFASFWIEGTPILWWILYVLLKNTQVLG
ncbi:hypothetical protein EI546_08305 [Aequorivita sp. H23M31]|uniref:Prenyltransferase n=1 Tax=Aequorivita ciconiae TaxID=2494375 RepID=A0A410G380_9FLAO|nr:hypothetical protein [Aequorivita sp. H23M31]QAA81726.1 hypothetical protein EI546_08305 [Aequorivita sp. H23M31]